MHEQEIPEILRIKWCPECGYDFTGLPRTGRCPECGFEFHDDFYCVAGTGYRGFANWPMMIVIFYVVLGPSYLEPWVMVVIGLALALAVFPFYLLDRKRRQWLLFTKEGVAARHTRGSVRIIPWKEFRRVTMLPLQYRPGVPGCKWEIRIYREPRFMLRDVNRRKKIVFRKTGGDIVFRVQALEQDAQHIIKALRSYSTNAWGISCKTTTE